MSSKSPGTRTKTKQLIYKVLMLDDQEVPFQIEPKTDGLGLINLVYQYLKITESDYFSLQFIDSKGKKCWIDYEKAVSKQLTPANRLFFCIKFYTPDPGQLEEEYTRYLYALQIKRDLAEGLLLCSDATACLLASYILQAEIGDYNEMYENDLNYFKGRRFFPHQIADHEVKIIEYHKNHFGQSPADADLNLLDIARKVELYGIIMHTAKDHESVQLNLAIAHMGILVFQNYTKINTFSWAKIRKLSFKRKKFLIKLHPENYGFYKDTVEFYFDNRDDSKNFWKICIEHHAFFRCVSSTTSQLAKQKQTFLKRGSSFRYFGRTQKELIESARESFSKNRTFDRSYNSMKSISQYGNELSSASAIITGTQSLNRNLCTRTTPTSPTSLHKHEFLSDNNKTSKSTSNLQHGQDEDDEDDDNQMDTATHGSHTIDSRISRKHRNLNNNTNNKSDQSDSDTDIDDEDDDILVENRKNKFLKNYIKSTLLASQPNEQQSTPPPQTHAKNINKINLNDDFVKPQSKQQKSSSGNSNTNMNKIYSRKEVKEVLSIKEETTQKRHEEYSSKTIYTTNNPDDNDYDDDGEPLVTTGKHYYQTVAITKLPSHDDDTYDGIDNGHENLNERIVSRPTTLKVTEQHHHHHSKAGNNGYNDTDFPSPPSQSFLQQQQKQPTYLLDYQDPKQISYILPINVEMPSKQTGRSNQQGCFISNNFHEDDSRKKRSQTTDDTYSLIKELLMTERTYKKDLELIAIYFRNSFMDVITDYLEGLIFTYLDPIYEFHLEFVKELETKFASWNEEKQRLCDVLSRLSSILITYKYYMEKYDDMLSELEFLCKKNKRFDNLYKDFEIQKICYLPFTMFLLKPVQRLLYYKYLLEKLLVSYGRKHTDYQDIYSVFIKIEDLCQTINENIHLLENKQKIIELQRELIDTENIIPLTLKTNKIFLREGSLQKLSRKGYQQRMFFLFHDTLIYCARTSSPVLQFKVHGEYPLKNINIEDGSDEMNLANSFTIYSTNKSIMVSAISIDEKNKWLNDIKAAIENLRTNLDDKPNYSTIKSNTSSENILDISQTDDYLLNDQAEQTEQNLYASTADTINQQHRSNSTIHVCWHRNISVSSCDMHQSTVNQLSGYLLRKFKNSNGWQKLWVVFTNFCLFFYKTYQDDHPLASLPLLGYTVCFPSETDNIIKDYVFKLQFKNHVYFFRTDSQYSLDRWLEVISSIAQRVE